MSCQYRTDQIQMPQAQHILTTLDEGEHSQLRQIIDRAQDKHHQINPHQRADLSLIPILCSFKHLYPHFPDNLYKRILHITKHYNPHTYAQWKAALHRIYIESTNFTLERSGISNDKIVLSTNHNSYTRIPFETREQSNRSGKQSSRPLQSEIRSVYQRSVNQPQHASRGHSVSQLNCVSQLSSKVNISKQRFLMDRTNQSVQFHSQVALDNKFSNNTHHYVSFNKENQINQSNAASCTPIDQSFVRQIQEEDKQLTTRAQCYRAYTIYLKVFSLLDANRLAYEQYKESCFKATLFCRDRLLQKSYEVLRAHMTLNEQLRRKESKALCHHHKHLKHSTFNVLKLVYEIRDEKIRITPPYNRRNYETMMMLVVGDTELQGKMDRLSEQREFQKVQGIVRYFGAASITLPQVEHLYRLHQLSIKALIFKCLSKEGATSLKYRQACHTNIKRKSFIQLQQHWKRLTEQRKTVSEYRLKEERAMTQKAFRVLISMAYSSKVYSKRCEYISNKQQGSVKRVVVRLWRKRCAAVKEERERRQKRMGGAIQNVEQVVKRCVMRMVVNYARGSEKRERLVDKWRDLKEKRRVLRGMEQATQKSKRERERSTEVAQKADRECQHKYLQSWKQLLRWGKAANMIQHAVRTAIWRELAAPLLSSTVHLYSEALSRQAKLKAAVFQALLHSSTEAQASQHFKSTLLRNTIAQNYGRIVKTCLISEIEARARRLISKKEEKLRSCLGTNRIGACLRVMMQNARLSRERKIEAGKKQERCRNNLKNKVRRASIIQLRNAGAIQKAKQELRSRRLAMGLQEWANVVRSERARSRMESLKKVWKHKKWVKLTQSMRRQVMGNLQLEAQSNRHRTHTIYRILMGQLHVMVAQKKAAVELANKHSRRQGKLLLSNALHLRQQRTASHEAITKLTSKIATAKWICLFKSAHTHRLSRLNCSNRRRASQTNRFLTNMHANVHVNVHANVQGGKEGIQEKKTSLVRVLSGKIILIRLERKFVLSLIRKKHCFMALKFRALKLAHHALRALRPPKPLKILPTAYE